MGANRFYPQADKVKRHESLRSVNRLGRV